MFSSLQASRLLAAFGHAMINTGYSWLVLVVDDTLFVTYPAVTYAYSKTISTKQICFCLHTMKILSPLIFSRFSHEVY